MLDEGNAKLLTLTVGVVASALSDRVAILHILPTAPPETEIKMNKNVSLYISLKKKKIICQTFMLKVIIIYCIYLLVD